MKKLLALMLALTVAFALCACGAKTEVEDTVDEVIDEEAVIEANKAAFAESSLVAKYIEKNVGDGVYLINYSGEFDGEAFSVLAAKKVDTESSSLYYSMHVDSQDLSSAEEILYQIELGSENYTYYNNHTYAVTALEDGRSNIRGSIDDALELILGEDKLSEMTFTDANEQFEGKSYMVETFTQDKATFKYYFEGDELMIVTMADGTTGESGMRYDIIEVTKDFDDSIFDTSSGGFALKAEPASEE